MINNTYKKGDTLNKKSYTESEEKSIFFALETILLTTLLTLIIVIPTNILLERYNTSDNYKNTTITDSNAIKHDVNFSL